VKSGGVVRPNAGVKTVESEDQASQVVAPPTAVAVDLGPFTGFHCPKCAYDLRGINRAECPECGQALNLADLQARALRPRKFDWASRCLVVLGASSLVASGSLCYYVGFVNRYPGLAIEEFLWNSAIFLLLGTMAAVVGSLGFILSAWKERWWRVLFGFISLALFVASFCLSAWLLAHCIG
jgi:hypothetical protein